MLKRESTAPGDRPLITIYYKYNDQKVLSSIDIEDDGSTK